jgi:hypothetical protein
VSAHRHQAFQNILLDFGIILIASAETGAQAGEVF